MQSVKSLIDSLNLIYYEYDGRTGRIVADCSDGRGACGAELVSITHLLRTKRIAYRVDGEGNVHLDAVSPKPSWSTRLAALFRPVPRIDAAVYVLSDKPVEGAINLPVFEIRPLPVTVDFSRYDALIVTSKNAVAAIDATDPHWKNRPVYTIAAQTAKAVKRLGGQVRFVGKEHHGDAFALELAEPLKGKRVLYLRAAKVVSNLVAILNANGVACEEAVVYESVCKRYDERIVLPKNAIIIFSSPSTIDCFLQNADWDSSYRAVAIGQTTAAHFPPHIVAEIADTTSLASCVSKALSIAERR